MRWLVLIILAIAVAALVLFIYWDEPLTVDVMRNGSVRHGSRVVSMGLEDQGDLATLFSEWKESHPQDIQGLTITVEPGTGFEHVVGVMKLAFHEAGFRAIRLEIGTLEEFIELPEPPPQPTHLTEINDIIVSMCARGNFKNHTNAPDMHSKEDGLTGTVAVFVAKQPIESDLSVTSEVFSMLRQQVEQVAAGAYRPPDMMIDLCPGVPTEEAVQGLRALKGVGKPGPQIFMAGMGCPNLRGTYRAFWNVDYE